MISSPLRTNIHCLIANNRASGSNSRISPRKRLTGAKRLVRFGLDCRLSIAVTSLSSMNSPMPGHEIAPPVQRISLSASFYHMHPSTSRQTHFLPWPTPRPRTPASCVIAESHGGEHVRCNQFVANPGNHLHDRVSSSKRSRHSFRILRGHRWTASCASVAVQAISPRSIGSCTRSSPLVRSRLDALTWAR